jgi:hypothetical protein
MAVTNDSAPSSIRRPDGPGTGKEESKDMTVSNPMDMDEARPPRDRRPPVAEGL